jgi:hypothetical protein
VVEKITIEVRGKKQEEKRGMVEEISMEQEMESSLIINTKTLPLQVTNFKLLPTNIILITKKQGSPKQIIMMTKEELVASKVSCALLSVSTSITHLF